jgi:ketosteroid isomerase-like protein
MEREDRFEFANPQEAKGLDERDRTLATPNFDENSIHHARPAVPLADGEPRTRSRTLPLVALAVLAGLVGGLVGILALSLYERRAPQEQPAQINSTTTQRDGQQSTRQAQTPATNNAPPTQPINAQTTPAPASNTQTVNAQTNSVAPIPDAAALRTDRVADSNSTDTRADDDAAQSNQRASNETDAQELRAALSEWITATNARDVDRQMKLYEPKVAAYYLSRNASREAVRAEKEHVFARASAVDVRAGDPEITLSPDGQSAAMRFRKDYQIAGDGLDRRGAVIQELRWRRTPHGWRITSERDLRVVP